MTLGGRHLNTKTSKSEPRCQEWVNSGERWDFHGHQCERIARFDPKKDAAKHEIRPFQHCKQHSVEAIAERRRKADERYKRQMENLPEVKERRRIAELEKDLEAYQEIFNECEAACDYCGPAISKQLADYHRSKEETTDAD